MANHGHPTLSNIIIYIEFELLLIPQILQIRKCFFYTISSIINLLGISEE